MKVTTTQVKDIKPNTERIYLLDEHHCLQTYEISYTVVDQDFDMDQCYLLRNDSKVIRVPSKHPCILTSSVIPLRGIRYDKYFLLNGDLYHREDAGTYRNLTSSDPYPPMPHNVPVLKVMYVTNNNSKACDVKTGAEVKIESQGNTRIFTRIASAIMNCKPCEVTFIDDAFNLVFINENTVCTYVNGNDHSVTLYR